MSENIIMPKLGMTMKEGTVEEWFKAEGDVVEQGESICTISSEKLTQDVEAPASGILLEIKVQPGEETEVKSVLGIIGDEGESTESISTTESDNEESNNSQSDDEEQQHPAVPTTLRSLPHYLPPLPPKHTYLRTPVRVFSFCRVSTLTNSMCAVP